EQRRQRQVGRLAVVDEDGGGDEQGDHRHGGDRQLALELRRLAEGAHADVVVEAVDLAHVALEAVEEGGDLEAARVLRSEQGHLPVRQEDRGRQQDGGEGESQGGQDEVEAAL